MFQNAPLAGLIIAHHAGTCAYSAAVPAQDDGVLLAQKTVDAALYEGADDLDDVASDDGARRSAKLWNAEI